MPEPKAKPKPNPLKKTTWNDLIERIKKHKAKKPTTQAEPTEEPTTTAKKGKK